MLKSLPSILSLLALLAFTPIAQAQQCLSVEVLEADCIQDPLGGTGLFQVQISPFDSSVAENSFWLMADGTTGAYFEPTTIQIPLGEFNQTTSLFFVDAIDSLCQGIIQIPNPCFFDCPLEFAIDTLSLATCGQSDGSISFQVGNFSPPYVIDISDGNGNTVQTVTDVNVINGLPAGDYQAVFYDATDLCQEVLSFTIDSQSDLEVDLSVESGTDGNVWTAIVTGGTPPYTYTWGDVINGGPSITLIQPGVYTLIVTDANGCTVSTSFVNEEFSCVDLSADVDAAYCGLNNGSITLSPVNELSNYTYLWNNGATTPSITDLEPGFYSVEVSNGEVCTDTRTYEVEGIDNPVQLIYSDIFNPCALSPGPVTVISSVPELSAEMQIVWTDSEGMVVTTESEFYPEEEGTYTLTVTFFDNPTCDYTEDITWTAPEFMAVSDSFPAGSDSLGCYGNFYYFTLNGNWVAAEVVLPNGNTITSQYLNVNQYGAGWYFATLLDNFCQGQDVPFSLTDSFYVSPEEVICQAVSGRVFLDNNDNCTLEDTDQLLVSRLVRLTETTTGDEIYAYSNLDGVWDASVPEGTYTAEVILNNTLFTNCLPLQTFSVVISDQVINLDLGIEPSGIECPQLTVELTMPLLRRCFFNPVWVYYNNTGTVLAEDAQIIVEVGEWVDEIITNPTSIPYDSVVVGANPGDPTLVYFTIGDVLPFESGHVSFMVRTCNDDAPLGSAACIRATGLPNNPCPPADEDWSGASLEVRGYCEDGQVNFRIRNVGDNPMLGPLNYVITEDAVMLSPQQGPVLQSGQEIIVGENATGSTFHILVDQVPNHPGLSMPTTFVEGCASGTDQEVSYGFALQIPPNDDVFWVDEDCFEIIGAYDPNDKLAEPRGYAEDHFIEPDTRLEYTIRFQNTGTDTAFNVVIRDTLSQLLDMSTIEIGAASHDYRVDIDTTGAINFFFPNIMLPDSFINEPASHGAISFRISPKAGLAPGTRIENRAGIYFDFNEPIITNTYFNTIELDFIQTSLFEFNPTAANLKIYPNPTEGPAWIELPPAVDQQRLSVIVTDMLGREQLRYEYGPNDRTGFDLAELARGWYAIQLRSDGQLLGTGRVLLE
ncbi:MAG: T9SS type A sorting domain-containing protein [Bacteroidota bacterium]